MLHGALNGDNTHEPVAVRNKGTHGRRQISGVFLKCAVYLGVRGGKLHVINHHLKDAGGVDLHIVDVLPGLGAVGAAENAVVNEIIQQRLDLLHGLADLFCEPARCALLAQSGGDGDIGLVVADDVHQTVVFRCVLVDLRHYAGHTAYDPGKLDDLGSELCHFCSPFNIYCKTVCCLLNILSNCSSSPFLSSRQAASPSPASKQSTK